MPYITPAERERFENDLINLAGDIHTPGQMNYIICTLLSLVVSSKPPLIGYSMMSKYRAAVLDAAEEFYRRVMVKYEDEKRWEHGDVFFKVLYQMRKQSISPRNYPDEQEIKVGGTD